ncbi:MAG: nitrile hydratase subunit alpha [Sphaerobacteraceae bacterium]|nr:MAG: nitrile hydratase subunit alpha [Sphaerobacteraceae bacterium]
MSDHGHDHEHGHDHSHGNGHPHRHPPAPDIELSDRAKRSLAIQELLVEKGIVEPHEIRRRVEEQRGSPMNGARVVARAWVDPEFKQRLLADARSAVAEMGFEFPDDTGLVVLENTEERHHLVVCTLCSCYPGALLGPPPDWYKSLPYRSRAVNEPRSVMSEFGLEIGDEREVRVVDSTAELRYMILPKRPAGTEGMSEDELAQLVPRDSMIGVAEPMSPDMVQA